MVDDVTIFYYDVSHTVNVNRNNVAFFDRPSITTNVVQVGNCITKKLLRTSQQVDDDVIMDY
jgi:hypothetical protein